MTTSSTTEGDDVWRPPIGFLVEGDGEYQSYRTLLSKGLGYPTGHLPISNAGGCGNLQKDLEDLLDELCRTHSPRFVVVTVDSRDFRNREAFRDCAALRQHLQGRADLWLQARIVENRGFHLPTVVTVVIQHPMYEGWLIADSHGLAKATDFVNITPIPEWDDVDSVVPNPATWLRERLRPGHNAKNPLLIKQLAGHLSPAVMATRSRSFRKFWAVVTTALEGAA